MSAHDYPAEAGKAEFEPSVLIEYGDAAQLTQSPDGQVVTPDNAYLS